MNKPHTSGKSEVLLGRITSVFGIKGWVKVYSYTEPMENLLDYPVWTLRHQGKTLTVIKTDGRKQGKGLVAKLKGYDTPEAAKLLAGAEICLPEEALPPLAEGEYYWNQLLGLQVFNTQGQLYGKVDYLLETGANDVLVVKPSEGSLDKQERLIPWLLPDVIRQVNLESGILEVDWDADF